MSSETIRSFIAVKLPETVVSHIADVQDELKRAGFRMSWVRPGNIHLTLKFLGNIEKDAVDDIALGMRQALSGGNPLTLRAKGLGVFPTMKNPRVLWVGLTGDIPALFDLQNRVEENMDRLGYPKENRKFKAHLTIARIKSRLDLKKLSDKIAQFSSFESEPFTVNDVILFQSDLNPTGAIYTPLAKAPLLET